MSLLDDLKGLNIDVVLNARVNISASTADADVQAVVDGGALTSVMGNLGTAIDAIVKGVDNPAALLEPLMQALLEVFDEISPNDFPLNDYRGAIEAGARILVDLAGNIGGDVSQMQFPGGKLGDLMTEAVSSVSRYAEVQLDGVEGIKSVFESLENGTPSDPVALAELIVANLLPFDVNALKNVRGGVDAILSGIRAVNLDATVVNTLVLAFDAVAAAAASKDRARLEAALADLERARHNCLVQIERALGSFSADVDAIDIGQYLGVISQGAELIKSGERGIIDFLGQMQRSMAYGRQLIENADTAQLAAATDDLFNYLENFLQEHIQKPIDQQVENLKKWLRGLLANIPLREYRAKLTALILGIAKTIEDANLGQYATQARAFLDDIEHVIDNFDIAQDIQSAVQSVNSTLDGFLGSVGSELNTIKTAIEGLAAEAASILTAAAEHLEKFQQTINELTDLLNSLDVEQAGRTSDRQAW